MEQKKDEKGNKKFVSIKMKFFLAIGSAILLIIIFLIIANNFALEKYYLYSKEKTLKSVYSSINGYYNNSKKTENIENQLEKISINNNFDILIKDNNGFNVYTTNNNFITAMNSISDIMSAFSTNTSKEIESNDRFLIRKQIDQKNGMSYLLLSGTLDNGYLLYIRMPINPMRDSVKISNHFLWMLAGISIIIAAILALVIAKKFTKPILELNDIAKKMSNLDFSQKYIQKGQDDEITTLGNSINVMSDKLERTINQLRNTNIELEKDIEEKSKLDEMRTSFISDVSHELKTPIALIQGYSEGLIENVNTDEENRKYYAEVIQDESNKMDRLVKQLLELMKLEYGKREFNNVRLNIVELEKETIRKSKMMIEEKNIEIQFNENEKFCVLADDFYIYQVFTNYLTNAIKNAKQVDGKKVIKITNEKHNDKVRITVFNTGEHIKEENLNRIWNRFYKADESRNRQDGGSGIGLSIVKAIMNNYKNDYGVKNVEDGVEFYFELDMQ